MLLLLTVCTSVSAKTYYVATPQNGGNDTYDGLASTHISGLHGPWASWEKAFTSVSVQPGDTVFIRGGIYYTTVVTGLGLIPTRNGTVDNWIVYINYPGETPIMDCGNITADDIVYTGLRNQGITITNINYIKLQGLTIRNVNQYYDRNFGVGIRVTDGNIVLENCIAHSIEGSGIVSSHGAVGGVHRFINCDAYNICDSIPPIGNVGNGFAAASDYYGGGQTYFTNCRAWHCADQGFNLASNSYVEADNCWSFLNTETYSEGGSGGGMGFKMGWQNVASSDLRRVVKNCIAVYNDGYGFFTNENGSSSSGGAVRSQHFNNIAYHNGYELPGYGWGFVIQNTLQDTEVQEWRSFSNNISYDNVIDLYDASSLAEYSGSNNSWDIPLTLTDADFVSLDTTGITAPRQADGSLPDNNCYNNFLKLTPTSKAINAGVDVGLPYNSSAPDLGPFEAPDNATMPKLVTEIEIAGQGGIATITENKGTLQLNATVLPSDATNKNVTWSIINGTGQATISSSGLVTAVANGTVTARATARDGSGVYGSLIITISGQAVTVSGITVSASGGAATITTTGGSLQLIASVLPANATDKSVMWSIINGTGQASISSSGLVTAVSNGTVTARATARDGSGVYGSLIISISGQTVTVLGITVSASGGAATITTTGGSLQLIASVLPANATDKTVAWSIINGTGQASISSSGLVTAVANGTVTARATAKDGSGVYGSLVVTISGQTPGTNLPPEVSISSPTKSTSFISPATVTIEATASDPDGTIIKVEFFNGNTKLGEKTTMPYDFTWKDVPEGSYSVTAAAIDNGNMRTVSGAVTVVVEKSLTAVNQQPVVSIIYPANNGNDKTKIKKNDKIIIAAEASDPDGSISMVEFKNGSVTLAEVTSAPYSFTWEPSDTGTFVITAIATDNLGATSASSGLELTVGLFHDLNSEIVNIYPNPNDGHFTIDVISGLSENNNRVTIFNLAGQIIYNESLEEHTKEIDISESTSGTYVIMITNGQNIIAAKKIIKN